MVDVERPPALKQRLGKEYSSASSPEERLPFLGYVPFGVPDHNEKEWFVEVAPVSSEPAPVKWDTQDASALNHPDRGPISTLERNRHIRLIHDRCRDDRLQE